MGYGPPPVASKSAFWAGAVLLCILVCSVVVIVANRKVVMSALQRALDECAGVKRRGGRKGRTAESETERLTAAESRA